MYVETYPVSVTGSLRSALVDGDRPSRVCLAGGGDEGTCLCVKLYCTAFAKMMELQKTSQL
jgi:hypothetical protein